MITKGLKMTSKRLCNRKQISEKIVIVIKVLIQKCHRWWNANVMMPAATMILAMSCMIIILIIMRVATSSRDCKKEAAPIVVVMEIACIAKTMNVTILQRPLIDLSHKVSTQDL